MLGDMAWSRCQGEGRRLERPRDFDQILSKPEGTSVSRGGLPWTSRFTYLSLAKTRSVENS
jgi:hypothetical protein